MLSKVANVAIALSLATGVILADVACGWFDVVALDLDRSPHLQGQWYSTVAVLTESFAHCQFFAAFGRQQNNLKSELPALLRATLFSIDASPNRFLLRILSSQYSASDL